MSEDLNVLLITIDSLRPDHLSGFGYWRETSPNIDKLSKESTNFTMAFSHGGGTPEAFPTMLSGVPPPVDIKQCDMGLRRGSSTSIASVLKNCGYVTAAFNSNPYLSMYFGYSDSFDTFHHNLKRGVERRHTLTGGGIGPYLELLLTRPPIIRGKELTKHTLSWIKDAKLPFFAWVHYMDVHQPYLPPSEYVRSVGAKPTNRYYMLWVYRRMFQSNKKVYYSMDSSQSSLESQELSKITNYYDGAIKYVDSCVAELLDGLETQRKLQDTIIILTADHGELLGEHGILDHGYLYDPILHVPFIIHGPGYTSAVVRSPVTHLLIQKTVKASVCGKELASIQLDETFADFGRGIISSVVDVGRNSYSCRTRDWQYIETSVANSNKVVIELYELTNDPTETINVAASHKEIVASFHERISAFIGINLNLYNHVKREVFTESEEQELNRKFRELGYT